MPDCLTFLRRVAGNLCPFSGFSCLWSQASCVHGTVGHCLPSLVSVWYNTVRGGRQPASSCASLLSSLPPMWSGNGYELVRTCLRAEGRHRQPGSLPSSTFRHLLTLFVRVRLIVFGHRQPVSLPRFLSMFSIYFCVC